MESFTIFNNSKILVKKNNLKAGKKQVIYFLDTFIMSSLILLIKHVLQDYKLHFNINIQTVNRPTFG